jgi:hypothetical protein
MDLFQTRKCEDFKRMILENIPDGGVVGLPVPLGYDDVLVRRSPLFTTIDMQHNSSLVLSGHGELGIAPVLRS